MPVYQYKCRSCGREIETTYSIHNVPKTMECFCGGKLHRVYTAPGVIFKGDGWPGQEIKRKKEKT